MCIIELPPVINIRKFCRAHFILLIYPRAMRRATRRDASLRSARIPRCVPPPPRGFLSPATLSLTGRAGVAREFRWTRGVKCLRIGHVRCDCSAEISFPPFPSPSSNAGMFLVIVSRVSSSHRVAVSPPNAFNDSTSSSDANVIARAALASSCLKDEVKYHFT